MHVRIAELFYLALFLVSYKYLDVISTKPEGVKSSLVESSKNLSRVNLPFMQLVFPVLLFWSVQEILSVVARTDLDQGGGTSNEDFTHKGSIPSIGILV